jgi:NADPH:quinone reductase-like Zn-dependent oxidoreductase
VQAVSDHVGSDFWAHSMSWLARGGTLVTVGGTGRGQAMIPSRR